MRRKWLDINFLSFNYSANTPPEELHLPKVVQQRDVVRALILAGTNSDNLIKLLDLRGIPWHQVAAFARRACDCDLRWE